MRAAPPGSRRRTALLALLPGLLLAALPACGRSLARRDVQPSGFLGDTSQLHAGEEGEAALLYIRPGADLSRYSAIVVDPVTVWASPALLEEELDPEDLQNLASLLHARIRERLLQDGWRLDPAPGPGAVRLRAALTQVDDAEVALDIACTVLPIGWLATGFSAMATGTPAFVGSASAEVELLDAASGLRLLAAVDRRVGGVALKGGSTSSWRDVEAIFDEWVARLGARLQRLGGPGHRP